MPNLLNFKGSSGDGLRVLQEAAASAAGRARVKGLPASQLARLGRFALLLAPVLMAAALFFTVWSSYRGVVTASELLARGQADVIQDAVRGEIRRRDEPDGAELGAVLEALAEEGVTYLATLDVDGTVLAQAGTTVASPAELREAVRRTRSSDPEDIGGGRMRSITRRPLRGGPPPRAGMPRQALIVEFEPVIAQRLEATARGTLAIGALTAGGLLIVALVLVRWLLRREVRERKLEHERRLASLGSMSAVLAHEIRNPLASLKGNAQLLARSLPEAEKTRTRADRVVGEAVRLEKLVNDLLEFARTGGLARTDLDPAALAREIAAAHGARVVVETDRAPARVTLDAERMRQVLANLVENALQISQGRVVVAVSTHAGGLRYAVRDEGPGIPEEDLERIFEPFFTSRTQGTGLGLAVARRVVELHGGKLTAANAPGGGAIFTIDLPR